MQNRLKDSWDEGQIDELHAEIVTTILDSDTESGVEAAVEYAKFLKHKGLDNQNYPIFLDLLLHQNEELIYALLADGKVLDEFTTLQKTHYLIQVCFELLKRFMPGDVFEMTLETLLGVLDLHYHSSGVGYKIYPVVVEELNNLGKFLDKTRSQADKINRIILDILGNIGELSSKDNKDHRIDRIGAHANKIRSAFLDDRAMLEDAMPASMVSQ